MKALSIRSISDETYEGLKVVAALNHRSMQEHVRFIIEREVRLTAQPVTQVAREWRERMSGRALKSTVADVREGRQR